MKLLRILILGLLSSLPAFATVPDDSAPPDAYWQNEQRTNPPSIPDASYLSSFTYTPLTSSGSSSPAIAEAITSDIQTLARGLENDPVRIFNYVHDHIRYVLYFGSKKGAELTLLEKSGNDFDQSALLVSLLRAAGYTNAAYQFGWMKIPYTATNGTHNDLTHWLGLTQPNTNWLSTSNYLENLFWGVRGFPAYYTDGNTYSNVFVFQRVWVTLPTGTNTYFLDPAFKVSESIGGINLNSALGLDTNTLLSAAGGSDAGYYVSGLNEGSLRGTLTGYTTNLLNYIQNNCPNAAVEQVLSGRYIVPSTNTSLPTSTSFPVASWTGSYAVLNVTNWANLPTNLMSSLSIGFAGTNFQWFVPQLLGQRLSLTFSTSGLAQLWQDDTLLAQNSTSGSGTTNVATGTHHPFGAWDFTANALIPDTNSDVSFTNSYQCTNANYALTYAFEPDWGWLQTRENQLDRYRQQGYADTSRQVVTETLNIMGLTYMLQSDRIGQILGAQIGVLQQFHNRFGRMSQEAGRGYYIDVYDQLFGFVQSAGMDDASFDREARDFDLFGYFGSALEHGIIEQLQTSNLLGASAVKMLEIANTNGQPIYLASSTNWTTVQGLIVNYPTAIKNRIAAYIAGGYYILLPQNGSNHLAGPTTWGGYGYISHIRQGASEYALFSISGGYQGGYVSDPTAVPNTPYVATTGQSQSSFFTAAPVSTTSITSGDPVDMADGTFQVSATDISVGQSEPRGITLSRFYNGKRKFTNPAGMAGGWLHNYSVTVVESSAPQAGLGSTTPAQMAPILAATCAAAALYVDTAPDPKNWLTTALIAKWGIDQLTRNGVSVLMGQDTLQFVKQPDGRFTPSANCTWMLSKPSAYSLRQRHGNIFLFDYQNRLTTIVDQYNQLLSVTYNSSNWVQQVTDWKSRYLSFNYAGSPQRLTSISDNTGRTVTYGYSPAYSSQGDLTSVTDLENKTNGYAYDTNHQITATYDGLGRLVVSNVYDGLGHVATQYTQGDTNKTWQIYWSGWQSVEKDPAGSRRVFTYDDKTRPISAMDALGNVSQTAYDGQDHVTTTVSPLLETNTFIYDWNNNLIFKIDPLGFTNQFLYDNQTNLVQAIDPLHHTNFFGYNAQFSLNGTTNGAGDWLSYVYNADGTLYSKTDSGGVTTYGYDAQGVLNAITYPSSLGTEGFVNNSIGDLASHTSGRGFVTTFQYNNRRELTNTIAPTNLTSSVFLDAADNVQATKDARGFSITNFWSATKHLTGMVFPSTSQGIPLTTNLYDPRDWLMSSSDPLQHTTLLTNDVAGRLISTTDPLLRTTRFAIDADGRKTRTTNAAQEVTQQFWDLRGQMTRLVDPATNTVLYAFDSAGNQIFLTNRNGKTWQFQYDKANRLTNTITPLLRSISQSYNDRGLLQSVKQPSTRTTTFGFDAKGRRTSRSDSVGTTTYGFDADNNLTNIVENAKTNSWSFDGYSRISTYQDTDGNLIQYRWDANGNLTNLVYPGARTVAYAYDSLNRLTNVTDWANRQTSFTYDLANRMTTVTRPNGTLRVINYDADGEVTNIVEKTTANLPIAFFKLGWTNSGRVAWEFAAPLPPTNSLTSRTMNVDADNRVTSFNGQTVSYDLDGNMTNGPLNSSALAVYNYDARNRLLNVGGLSYGYDAAANRIAVTNGTTFAKFVINPVAKLPQVLMRISSGVTNYYVYGVGLLYQVTETATRTNTLTYHFDLRGSTIALTDGSGNITDQVQYSAYGLMLARTGTNDTPFLYNGRFGVMTDANGLLYMRARYYNPYLCRFVNSDPSGFAAGLNWYCYAGGNPISLIDPFGLCAQQEGFWSWLGNKINSLFDGSGDGLYGLPSDGQLAHAAIDNVISSVTPNAPPEVQRPMAYAFGSYDPASSVPAWADISVIAASTFLGLPDDTPVPAPAAPTESLSAVRRAIAQQFYESAGWDAQRIANHLEGIDFSRPLSVTMIPKGTQVVQYQLPGAPTGNYFAPIGTPANSLGIYTGGRVAKIFTAGQDTSVLRSTAASVRNTWEVPTWSIDADGGGAQYFTPAPSEFY